MIKDTLLIVDDDETIRSQMRWALISDYEVHEAGDHASALEIAGKVHPLVVILDLGLPPKPREAEEGLRTLKDLLALDIRIKVIIVSGNTEKGNALRAIDMGAFDFFTKPPVIDEVRVVIKRALRMTELEVENQELQRRFHEDGLEGILGSSPSMDHIYQTIRKVATVDVPVLILGESGTGKELTARAIHRLSSRREKPFIVINCGAIPEALLESELFGHEKGAFTGADSRKKGRIEYAEGGTLFLDEIGELTFSLQVKLLRFLQEHIIERLGGREEIPVDVRILAATNRDLKKAIEEGKFREDLYFRLTVVSVFLPPLKDRGNDTLLLARAFLQRYSGEFKKNISGFRDEAMTALSRYAWPGNVRELENRIKRAVVMSDEEWLTSSDLELTPPAETVNQAVPVTLHEARETLERHMINEALLKHGNNITHAAKDLAVSRQTLTDMIRKYGILVK